jgi:chemotaxis protein histidine kinase CheA
MNAIKSVAGIFLKSKSVNIYTTVTLFLSCLLILPSVASASIGRISSFKGEVIVQSGDNIARVVARGHLVNNGDILLTKQGEAQVTFTDGGIVRINAHTQISIQERKEESGVLFFKRTGVARRVTCYLGKLWFKSGLSKTQNYMQSPTAVAGLRGSDGDFGFNPATMQTFMNMYSGEAAVVGNVMRGFFENPGISAAQKSAVYQSLVQAANKTEAAKASGKTIDQAQAKVVALQVVKQAAQILIQNNPDAKAKQSAQLANATADASISAAKATVAVEHVKEAQKAAEKAAKEEKDPAKAKQAEEAAQKAATAAKAAEAAAAAAARAAETAKKAADTANTDQLNAAKAAAEQASQRAQTIETDTQKIVDQVVTTTVAPTTVAPTTAAPTSEAPTTVAATVETTMPTTVQTTTSTTTIKSCPSPPCP